MDITLIITVRGEGGKTYALEIDMERDTLLSDPMPDLLQHHLDAAIRRIRTRLQEGDPRLP